MGLASAWARKLIGVGGASLLAPTVVLVAAAAIAIGGGGLAGLRSLGQVTAGPSLAEPAQRHVGKGGLARAEIVGVGLAAQAPSPRAARQTAAAPSATPSAPAGPSTPSAPPPAPPPIGGTPGRGGGVGPPNAGPVPPAPPTGGGPSRPPNLVVEVIENTARGLGRQLAPLVPVTDNVLDLLLGPPPATR